MACAPVALFGYNRADHLEATIAHLRRNDGAEHTDIHLFSDGAKNAGAERGVEEVRKFGRSISGFKKRDAGGAREELGVAPLDDSRCG